MANTLVQVRLDNELKLQASQLYESLGIDLSTAIRMFLKRSILANGIPFSMTLPVETEKSGKGLNALKRLSASADRNNVSDMTLEEINAEIHEYRTGK